MCYVGKKRILLSVILNVQCLLFGFSVLSLLLLDHTCLYKEIECIGEMKRWKRRVLLTEWPRVQFLAYTHTDNTDTLQTSEILEVEIPHFYAMHLLFCYYSLLEFELSAA